MAAVLCREFNNVCSGSCDVVGKVITFPCRVCGMTCHAMEDVCCSPFSLYLFTAIGLNLPGIVWYFKTMFVNNYCVSSTKRWLLINAIFCAGNALAACYIANQILKSTNAQFSGTSTKTSTLLPVTTGAEEVKKESFKPVVRVVESPSMSSSTSRSKSMTRVKHVLCEDPIVAMYIVFGILYILWTIKGVSLDDENCANGVVQSAILLNFLFIALGSCAFCCSLVCL